MMKKHMDDSSGETIARCQTLFEEFQDAIAILTREAQVLDMNQACLDLLGYERKEIIGMDVARLLIGGPDALHWLQSHIERGGSVKDHDMQFRRKDGTQIDCVVTAAAWPDKDGLRGYIAVVRDVTAQNEREHSLGSLLRMSEKVNSEPDLDSLLDRLVEQLLELTGAESGCAGWRTSQGMSCDHFFQGPRVLPLMYYCASGVGWAGWLLEHGSPYITNDAAHDPVIALEVRERLGVRSGMAIPIVDSEKDVIAFFEVYNNRGAAGFSHADLDHGLAAAQIASLAIHNRLLHRNLSALAAFSQSLTVTSDFDQILEVVGGHLEVNFKRRSVILLPNNGGLIPRFRNAELVFSESELAAATWSWEHGQDAGRSTDIMSAAQAHYLPLKARGEVIGVLGLEVKPGAWFSSVQRQLFSAFISQAALAIERGLLEQKGRRLRFLEGSDKVKNAVLSAISHDVRTPLAAITASLSGLLTSDGALDQAAERQLLETADIEARRLRRLVNNLLSMTGLETGAPTVRIEPCDLLDVVSAALEEVEASARQRQVCFDIAEDLPLVPMDFRLITYVFINLLSNAFKYSAPGQPVEVRGRIIDDRLEVLVVDKGVGVPLEDLGRVFDKFYRAAQSGSSTGLGLGLAICKAFIEAHNGRISLEPNPAGGTIAKFVIPFHPFHEAERPWAA
jgi:two-component system sensor histidine kinase KdpD